MDNLISGLMRAALLQGGAFSQPVDGPPMPPAHPFAVAAPIQGKLTYGRMPAHVAFTPGQQRHINEWERGGVNRAVLESALRNEKRPFARELLLKEHDELFGPGGG